MSCILHTRRRPNVRIHGLRILAAWHSFSFAPMELHRIICTKHYHAIEHQMVLHVRVCNVCSGNTRKQRENETQTERDQQKCFRSVIFACKMSDYDGGDTAHTSYVKIVFVLLNQKRMRSV